ncbi:Aliphatic nitrilase OS=Afipia felis OX=1035 GN=nitA_1 PE=3 SV=1 [Afipia felis]
MVKFTASVVQAAAVGNDTEATLAKAEYLIAACGQQGAELALFPEAFLGGYPKGANFEVCVGRRTLKGRDEYAAYWAGAIVVPGPETARLGQAARDAKLFLTMGVIEREGGTLYCTVLFFGPDGALLGKHRKTMPTAAERLCWGFGDGSTLTTVETPWGKLGAVICWENYMPLLRMTMYGKGIAIYCAPTADDRDSWTASMRHIAMEGRCFVLSACQYLTRQDFPSGMVNTITDRSDEILMRGGSLIVDPFGEVLAGPTFDCETILTAQLETADITRGKFDLDVAGHYARPDIFSLMVDERPMQPVNRVK